MRPRRGVGGAGEGYIQKEKHYNLQSVKPTFFQFFQYKACIAAFLTLWKMWNLFEVTSKNTAICKVNKNKNKDTVDVFLTPLLLT